MRHVEIPYTRRLEDDADPLFEAIAAGLDRPLVLWAHPDIGQTRLVETAARRAGLPFRLFETEDFENWDGFRDVSESGHFREVSIERFLQKGERADPGTFALAPGAVLHLRGLNRAPTRLVQAVFDQIVSEGKLLNNPLPDRVRIVASAHPPDLHESVELLGPPLAAAWNDAERHASLKYPVFPLPRPVIERCEHWAVMPSVRRFVQWGRAAGLSEEVLRFLEDEEAASPERATASLHAALVLRAEPFPQAPSPRAFADLGALLAERRPYFSSRRVHDAARSATGAATFQRWLHEHMAGWDPESWIEADSSLTLRGESVPGSAWLRNLIDEVRSGTASVALADLPTYSVYEQRSISVWATQELGDELGARLARSTRLTPEQLAHLG